MTTPKRIQLKRTKGWRKPEGAVVVSRPSRWGNPFKVGETTLVERYYPSFTRMRVTPRDQAESAQWFSLVLGPDWGLPDSALDPREIRRDLAGRDLACWCPLGAACHADVLLAIANGSDAA